MGVLVDLLACGDKPSVSSDETFFDVRLPKTAVNTECPFGSLEKRNVVSPPLPEELVFSPRHGGRFGLFAEFQLGHVAESIGGFLTFHSLLLDLTT